MAAFHVSEAQVVFTHVRMGGTCGCREGDERVDALLSGEGPGRGYWREQTHSPGTVKCARNCGVSVELWAVKANPILAIYTLEYCYGDWR